MLPECFLYLFPYRPASNPEHYVHRPFLLQKQHNNQLNRLGKKKKDERPRRPPSVDKKIRSN